MRSGQIARTQPLCPSFGYSRGRPIDRFYIEKFLADHAGDIRGRVLEIGDDAYSRRFGGDRITRQDVLDVRPGQPGATLTGSLADPDVLPAGAFDCIILTQTLHLIFDLQRAVDQVRRALGPDGVALITVPGISAVDRSDWGASWQWSFTAASLQRLLGGAFDPDKVACAVHGNLFAATAFLHGAAVEDVNANSLGLVDAAYPVTIVARAAA